MVTPPQRSWSSPHVQRSAEQVCRVTFPGRGQSAATVQVQEPEVKPPPLTAVQEPLEHVTPQTPQFVGSFDRFLHDMALGPVEQHAVPLPLQALCRQSVSAQSVVPSQSLSTPSLQVVSVAPVGVHVQLVPTQVDVPVQAGPVPQRQVPPEQRLAWVGLQAEHVVPGAPHAAIVGIVTQVLPLQQPGQVAVSQTQVPA